MIILYRNNTAFKFWFDASERIEEPVALRSDASNNALHPEFLDALTVATGLYARIEEMRARLLYYRDEFFPSVEARTLEEVQEEQRSLSRFMERADPREMSRVLTNDWTLYLWQYSMGFDNEITRKIVPPRGYVYFVRSVTGHVKIGFTKDPKDRIRTFGVQLPMEVEFELLIPAYNYKELEKELHRHFESNRVGGEWFNLTDKEIDMVHRIYGGKRFPRTL